VKHFLQNNFGKPYDTDYYAGDFLMGPNLFCLQQICDVGSSDIANGLGNIRPKELDDLQLFINKIKLVAETFSTYINNLRLGVKAGMVCSTEECLAGINAFKRSYLKFSLQGEQGMCSLVTWHYLLNIDRAQLVSRRHATPLVTSTEVLCDEGCYNRPFPRYLVPLFQNESSCKPSI